ncbi:peptidoglycan DD-metalloendopeptidase family protein [Rheinheimera baltica]|uniref:peptidoglycan DD-metalloendopeptidase family protein n=1 Tax=Rheinheimera baltica TaxID=67576 RepID=UPI00273EDA2B|nr:peptidoglycan DD-metalloendopeptidase family protein [Rheinheimera baltica]MDP5143913.1 peptidoglycan DD-metalloendopeptidase family protein [Rheinheimera baltica]MDP5151659.1 peptidoglycan DD-metalloendopeptidase family protein [Rheinheimera baltica]MDP5191509.1 peptidoglycan DD-metalloendopeptidase family protein [Rheinheimera baltica]
MRQFVTKIPPKHRALIAATSVFLSIVLLLPSEPVSASKGSKNDSLEIGKRYSLDMPETIDDITPEHALAELAALPEEDLSLNWSVLQVQKGDALSALFKKANVSQQVMLDVLALGSSVKTLTRIFPGEQLEFGLNSDGELQELRYALNHLTTLRVSRDPNGQFVAEELKKDVELRSQFANAEIRSNFWSAGIEAGLSESQIMSLAGIFGWDIDFGLDIRAGDNFSVLYETQYVDGEFISNGNIIAAQFSNQGHLYQAVRHTDGNYYKPDGASMRQAFLRAPVSFQYVSSNFNPRRLHPVLKTVRPHNGVDYVAPVGTPIMAAGEGRVIASAYNNLNGHYVFIQHANNIVTKYLHLSKRLVSKGEKVRQGEAIGRLGSTGRVTGAHLHYEFLVSGVHRNPRTVKLPQATPLQGKDKELFTAQAQQILAQLQTNERVLLAKTMPDNATAAP